MSENQNETKDNFLTFILTKISLYYDMLCFHQCQRGRLLKIVIQLYVFFDVTQNVKPYQVVNDWWVLSRIEEIFLYMSSALIITKFRDSIDWGLLDIEGRSCVDQVYLVTKVKLAWIPYWPSSLSYQRKTHMDLFLIKFT